MNTERDPSTAHPLDALRAPPVSGTGGSEPLQVMTVRGPIAPEALGVTLPHEHLLCDLRAVWHAPPPERADLAALVDVDPQPRDRGPLSSDPYVCRPNLLLDDPDLAAEELAYFRAAGGRSLVELTVQG